MPTSQLANALFHITGAIVDRGYVPGLATAIVLYLPYFAWVAGQATRLRLVAPGLLAADAVLGAIPMACTGTGSCSSVAVYSRPGVISP